MEARSQQQPLSLVPPTFPLLQPQPQPQLLNSRRMINRITMQEQLLLPKHMMHSPRFADYCSIVCEKSKIEA